MCSTPSWFSASVSTQQSCPPWLDVDDGPTHFLAVLPKLSPMRHSSWTRKEEDEGSLWFAQTAPHPETTATTPAQLPSLGNLPTQPPAQPPTHCSSHRCPSLAVALLLGGADQPAATPLFLLSSHMGLMPSWEAGW